MNENLIFIKLGGSLITDKDQPDTARPRVIHSLMEALQTLRETRPELQILLGHGSGSFGHAAAKRHHTQDGVKTSADWLGFAEVAQKARELNELVTNMAISVGMPVIVHRPSALVLAQNHQIIRWDTAGIKTTLDKGGVPLIYGDAVIDTELGGTILSTEELFVYLAATFKPSAMLISGIEAGVYSDYPANSEIAVNLSKHDNLHNLSLRGASAPDVTGGMLAKVKLLQSACQANPGMKAYIFSGMEPENFAKILAGHSIGTKIS